MDVSLDCRFTALCADPAGQAVAVGDAIGAVSFFDLRRQQQCGVVRGAGGVRGGMRRGKI